MLVIPAFRGTGKGIHWAQWPIINLTDEGDCLKGGGWCLAMTLQVVLWPPCTFINMHEYTYVHVFLKNKQER